MDDSTRFDGIQVSDHAVLLTGPAENQGPAQRHDTYEGTRRTVPGWLTEVAKRMVWQKEKSYDDAGFRRGRARMYPSLPGEENRNRGLDMVLEERTSRDLEGETSIRSATGKGNADRGMSKVLDSQRPIVPPALPLLATSHHESDPLPKPELNDELQRGSEEPSRASNLGNSMLSRARISDGTSKPTTADALLTEAMQ